MQLDACLRTFALSCTDDEFCQKKVIFKCTDPRHTAQYDTLRKEYPDVEFVAESDFHEDLQAAISGFSYVLFMVDDNLCVRRFRLAAIVSALEAEALAIGFSLRLGRNIELCYSYNDTPQQMPPAEEVSPGNVDSLEGDSDSAGKMLRFPWGGAPLDFGYPMEVSSSVFRVQQILSITATGERIKHPNGLEERLDAGKARFAQSHPDLLCFEHSAAFCNPLNVVQYNYLNRTAGESTLSANSLTERFELGYRFDVGPLEGFQPKSCHQEKEMGYLRPRLDWEKIKATLQMNFFGGASAGCGEMAPLALQCAINSQGLADDSLQSVLVGLDLIGAPANDPSVSWIETLGKRHREKLLLQDSDPAKKIEALKEHFSRALKLNDEQREAIAAQSKTISETIAALTPALEAKYELEQIHKKGWFRFLNEASNRVWSFQSRVRGWVGLVKGLRTLQDVKSLFHIEENSQLSDGQFYFRGWLLVEKTRAAAEVRAEAISFTGKYKSFPAVARPRPDVAAHFGKGPEATASGFEISGSLPGVRSFITLQYCSDGKWYTFVRFTVQNKAASQPMSLPDFWPKEKPLVSVVIPCHNRGEFLLEAVDSVHAQTWQDLEIIVVDDGSDDAETIRVIDGLHFPSVRVVREPNSKLQGARNTGISAASGKYICCLNPGDKLDPTYIEKCLLRLVIEGFDICGSWQREFGSEDQPARRGALDPDALLESNQLVNSPVFPRHLWETAGGFDPAMADGFEDWEFWIRVAARGAQTSVIPEPLFQYRKNGHPLIDAAAEKFGAVVEGIRKKYRQSIPKLGTRTPSQSRWKELLDRGASGGKIRVLVCLPYLTIGGAEKIISQVCRGLSQEGFHFTVITTKRALGSQGNSAEWFEAATSEIFCLPECLPEESWKGFISYLILSRRVDILWQAGSAFIYDFLPELKTLFPELKVVDILFNDVGHTANNRKYDYLIDLHITESNAIRTWLTAHGESEDRIRVIPNGVDLSNFKTNKKQPAPFDTGGREFIVGFFGRLSNEKGPDLFVEIAGRLKGEKNILFVIGGHGSMENTVRARIAELGLGDSVKMLGFCSVETHLSCCDLLVVPSRQDGRPNVVMEAMAMGVPVVASNVGGMAELVLEGYSGLLCDALDTRQFSETIAMLSHDQERCEKLRPGAQLHARENFDIRKTVASFSEAFHELLPESPPAHLLEATAG